MEEASPVRPFRVLTTQAEELAGVVGVRGGSEKLLSVLDTNVALNQLDFLEAQSSILGVVMILQVS